MFTFVRSGLAVLSLCLAHAAVAAELSGAGQKDAATRGALDALLGKLDGFSQDHEMTTAKMAFYAKEAVDKFNQQYKGKSLTVRLKVQNVLPSSAGSGYCILAHEPDLAGVQSYTFRFQDNLSSSDILSVKKEETVLAVTGLVSASSQAKFSGRLSTMVKPGGNVSFPLRAAGLGCQVSLEGVSFKLETVSAVQPAASTSKYDGHLSTAAGGDTSADRLKSEHMRSMDDVKLFFMKGILAPPPQTTTGTGTRIGSGTTPSTTSRYNSGNTPNTGAYTPPPKYKHNRIYTAAEIMQKFGTPSARSSKGTAEEWVYKCKDGAVHLHFAQSGFVRSVSANKPDSLKLEIKSIDTTASTRSY